MPYKGSEAEKNAVKRYQQGRDAIMLRPNKEEGAQIRKEAEKSGKSVQRYILDILKEKRE